jgi:hypothetical protein
MMLEALQPTHAVLDKSRRRRCDAGVSFAMAGLGMEPMRLEHDLGARPWRAPARVW